MHPRLWATPYFTLHTFGVLFAVAFLVALWWVVRAARRDALRPNLLMSLGLWAIVGGILGAKLLLVLRTLPEYLSQPSQLWSLSFVETAGDFYGGFLGALVACVIYFWLHPELPACRAADLCAPAIALGQAIGRIGCFMAGDDYGSPANVPWSVTFTDPEAARVGGAPLGVPLHPVQLYESLVCFALFLFLWRLSRRKQFEGEIILTYALLYAVARFLLEYFRGDADRGFVFGGALSTSQLIALLLFAASITLLVIRRSTGMRI
jgi:phosphatidylglycerol---prolipoprotein diacylglyceryl transferase